MISIARTAIRKATKLEIAVLQSVKTTIVAAKSETKLLLRTLVITNLVETADVPAAITMVMVKILLLSKFISKRKFL